MKIPFVRKVFSRLRTVLPVLIIILLLNSCERSSAPVHFVDPFIGTDGHGHTFPGATVPFGMVQLSPDTRKDSWDGCSGYHYSDSLILGFSHTHLSGTGVGDYGDIRLMPTTGELILDAGNDQSPGYRSAFSHKREVAKAGYYSVYLSDYQIFAELTATKRSGMHRYTFPSSKKSQILVDLFESVTSEQILDAEIQILNDSTIAGFRRSKGWADDQHCYFYAVFSKPFQSFGIRNGDELKKQSRRATGKNLVAWVGYETRQNEKILVKVGISAVDIEGAKNNLQAEIQGWNFDQLKNQAENDWNNQLGILEANGGSDSEKTIFYTALYHSMIAPNLFSDADGRYRGHDKQIHQDTARSQYTVFSLWDTFRALHPMFNLIQRERSAEFIQTMLNIQEQGGILPVWELSGNETWCMIGYHSVPVIADAVATGMDGFDKAKALKAMQKSAMQDQFGLEWYKSKGYIPADKESESVSKTLEYAYDDWCIAAVAGKLGNDSIKNIYSQRSENYKNLYDPATKFFRGRQNGGFVTPFDPTQVNFMLTEANTWQYNFFVPHDIQGHIKLMGGQAAYAQMLDSLFKASSGLSGRQQADITGLIGQYAHGNEPSHHMAYLYNYVQQASKTQLLVQKIMTELYSDRPDGLSGNEDCGQMSAWYVMSALGFYPVTPGSGIYAIGMPVFEEMKITLENGKFFIVKTKNRSKQNSYIASVQLNGKPYQKSFITAKDILEGGELLIELGTEPSSSFGIGEGNYPIQKIDNQVLVSVPWIKADSKTFTSEMMISMGHSDKDAVITYTLNDKEPNLTSQRYTQPFAISSSSRIKAKAFQFDESSVTVMAEFYKIAGGKSITLTNPYSPQYHAGGDIALIDNQFGSADFRTGSWQGFYGDDLLVTIDLGNLQTISQITSGFLQDQKSWIFLPQYVEYQVSTDGEFFETIGKVNNSVSDKQNGGIVKRFSKKFPEELVRFVRVKAVNRGVCPDWHPGKGEKSWIFADEIEIR
ncbi:MAG: GH92 family glycosyl hydrolase [Bacteroidales bacterium]